MGCKPSKDAVVSTFSDDPLTVKGSLNSATKGNTSNSVKPTKSRDSIPALSKSSSTTTAGSSNNMRILLQDTIASNDSTTANLVSQKVSEKKPERLFKLLAKALTIPLSEQTSERQELYCKAVEHLEKEPTQSSQWKNPTTGSTPLHMACRLIDVDQNQRSAKELCRVMDLLLQAYPAALLMKDASGNIPLHYAMAPSTLTINPVGVSKSADDLDSIVPEEDWRARGIFVQHLMLSNLTIAQAYWQQNDVIYESSDATGGCSPLYRVLQTLPDDFDPNGPTVEYVRLLQGVAGSMSPSQEGKSNDMAGIGNASDGDKPLGLLYRRFTRQFDISEMFFAGDNSRPEVVEHRNKYKCAAGNTWKIIECLLKPPIVRNNNGETTTSSSNEYWGIVHRAVQMETPPDLLRYIVETNAQDLTKVDSHGNLPLHYAAMVKPPKSSENTVTSGHFPAFYTKYVVDELLYKFPEAANMTNGEGKFPLELAISTGKQWIGGGIKSLYDAYPQALEKIDLEEHASLQRALSMARDASGVSESGATDEKKEGDENTVDNAMSAEERLLQKVTSAGSTAIGGIIKDEQYDAIMLVQQENVDVTEVTTSMWAHEEDAGVQMLGCMAISRLLKRDVNNPPYTLRIALTATASVVNAMKAHPNEMIVQEKACAALKLLSPADGLREVSMVASGAVAAIVAAMQAHVGDANVQAEACAAIAAIVKYGGGDRATVVASVSGVTAILNAIAAHPSDPSVQKEGCQALLQLTEFASTANLPELPKAQTEPLLAQARETFPNECGDAVDILMGRMS
ncbi:ankyrin repeat domain protein [Nitzschia inconspicua]|uniref:Ankyrin repeat domain protein n=1 Tax=Nitzschia inconspicua TaxID=303405 RepID=A0A9K3LJD5_9STRA|nr:ankyrin repeat domain protein [Nitzschia inconspicua]